MTSNDEGFMEAYRLAKITGLLLTLAIVGFYHRKIPMAMCGLISVGSLITSLLFGTRLSERSDSVLSMCGALFGFLTFALWVRSSMQGQRKVESQQKQ
jgi:hypothetical protein